MPHDIRDTNVRFTKCICNTQNTTFLEEEHSYMHTFVLLALKKSLLGTMRDSNDVCGVKSTLFIFSVQLLFWGMTQCSLQKQGVTCFWNETLPASATVLTSIHGKDTTHKSSSFNGACEKQHTLLSGNQPFPSLWKLSPLFSHGRKTFTQLCTTHWKSSLAGLLIFQ